MNEKYIVYAGTVGAPGNKASVSGSGEGVYTFVLDENMHVLRKDPVQICANAGIITADPKSQYLYAANETKDFTGLNGSGGGVSAFRIQENGTLEKVNDSISYGARNAYVTISENGKYLACANHGSHSTVTCHYRKNETGEWVLERGFDDSGVALFNIENGRIGSLLDLIVFDGSGYWCHGGGQSTSHIHCVKFRDDLLFACNRGADEIEVMKIVNHRLQIMNRYKTRYGYAPRHMDFHPEKKILYVCNENYPSVSVYEYKENGELKERQMMVTMDKSYYVQRPLPFFDRPHALPAEKNNCGFADRGAAMPADIHIRADGKFLYVSNRHFLDRGSVCVFAVRDNGLLEKAGIIALDGKDPRGFTLSEDGRFLLAGMLDQNRIHIYALNETTGMPEKEFPPVEVPSPASVIFRKMEMICGKNM